MRILVVDDSKAVHAYIRSIFSESQYELTHVYDGSEALKAMEGSPEFDAILLDWEMPVMTGPETLKHIRQSSKVIPIIMVTTKNDVASISEAMGGGASEYIMKPFTKDIIIEKLNSVTSMGVP